MTLGKYVNTDSLIHRLDPRNKFILLFVFMVLIFVNDAWIVYLGLCILMLILFKIAKLKISLIFKSLKAIWFMMFILFIINLFIYKDGTLLIDWWIFKIYSSAILKTLKIIIRLALLICTSTLFTSTTKPLDITLAIDSLFGWLKIFKINVSIFSMTISITLRFIPTILDETYRIMKAQASRGVDLKNGKLKEKVVAITSLIIPLIISSFSRSEELANAMEARNYDPLKPRTKYRKLNWAIRDTITMILSFALLGGIIFLKVYFKDPNLNAMTLDFIKQIIENIKG